MSDEKVLTEKDSFISKSWDYDSTYEGKRNAVPERFGLCSSCTSFLYVQYDSGKENIGCLYDARHTLRIPNGNNPVNKCSNYSKRGQSSLQQMAEIAYFIEGSKKKIGFLT